MELFHFVWAASKKSGNGLAPVQVFHAVPSPPFSAPAELAGLGPGHLKARCVFPSEENLLASRLRSPSPFGRGTMPAPPLHTAFFMTWSSPIYPGSLEGRLRKDKLSMVATTVS